ncbi:MAG: OmpH family outer membrane protein [Desulfobaccales bacterium]|nr:OmpH family outer membrane protein [Desulfobaccales bacterium]
MGLLILTPVLAAAELRIGVVDNLDIMSNSSEGKRVLENLRKKGEELGRPIQQRQQDFAKMMAEAEKQAAVMKEDARKRKEEELSKKFEEIKRQESEAQKQFAQYEEQQRGPLIQKMIQAVDAVAKENKLDLVLSKTTSGLLFMDPKFDYTEKVRSKFGR